MSQEWIGTWSPGIGDPTIGGWLTVALYAWAAWESLRILRFEQTQGLFLSSNERLIWRTLLAAMIILGINKQLDIQSALTESARILALNQGWYGNRRQYQEAFIAAIPIVGLTALAAMLIVTWKAPKATLWACAGLASLTIFVAIRAASFHHVDMMLGWRLGVLPLNWILEMGSLIIIGLSARNRARVES